MNSKTYIPVLLLLFLSLNSVFAQKTTPNDTLSSKDKSNLDLPSIQVIPITDSRTGRQYELYIKLPDGYLENDNTKYPVLYFTDALWHIEILSGTTEYLTETLILVGISWEKRERPEVSRYRDYTILESMNPNYQSGDADTHLTFIRNDVFSYIENNYRTAPDERSYFGYSQGGTFGAYIALTQPKTFKNYLLGSPVPLLDDSYIHEHLAASNRMQKELQANVFISYGDLEKEGLIGQAKELTTELENINRKGVTKLVVIESADHSRAFPMMAVRSMYWLSDLINK